MCSSMLQGFGVATEAYSAGADVGCDHVGLHHRSCNLNNGTVASCDGSNVEDSIVVLGDN